MSNHSDDSRRSPDPALARTVRIDPDQLPGAGRPPADDPMRRTVVLNRPPEMPAVAWLVADRGAEKGKVHQVSAARSTLGADRTCDVVLTDAHVSDRHASLRFDEGGFVLTDLDSTNGTRVNGESIQRQSLADGDRIELGGSSWIFKCVVFADS